MTTTADTKMYDAVIIGGGLAGLALSIQLAGRGHHVVLFEKEKYPFHKVCGEYISLESWDFLKDLGLPLDKWSLPIVKKLQVSSPSGNLLKHDLPLGGFGISRYKIDAELAMIARKAGVEIREEEKVNDVEFAGDLFNITSPGNTYQSKIVAGSFGKRSNLDVKWKRKFVADRSKLSNYIGIKYHIQTDFPADTIALHNFTDGYCGIVKIEGDKYNLCYLATAGLLHKHNNSIRQMEQDELCRNPYLKKIFEQSTWSNGSPLTISQISFDKKSQVEDHILMVGDAAGMITPLCGNGMSMALHGSKIAAEMIGQFLDEKLSREEMEEAYSQKWKQQFGKRLKTGRIIQRLFGHNTFTGLFIRVMKLFPGLVNILVRQTHGKVF